MTDQLPLPSFFVFNVAKAGSRHTCEVPNDAHLLLPTFSSLLNSARKHGYVVQGALYGPAGATVFIDTDDENWHQRVDSDIPVNIKNIVTVPKQKNKSSESQTQVKFDLESPINNYTRNLQANKVLESPSSIQIFKVENTPSHHVTVAKNDDEPQSLLKEFVEAIHTLLGKGDLVECATYGAQEGAKIFVGGSDNRS